MAKAFDGAVFEEWQGLIDSWDRTERELAELVSARDDRGLARSSQRETELREERVRLKAEIDAIVGRMANSRDRSSSEMVVALIDTKPAGTSFATLVRERLSRIGGRRE